MIILRRLASDVAIWFAATLVFLTAYTAEYSFPFSAIPAHLRVAAVPLVAILVLRIAFALTATRTRIARGITAAAVSTSLLVMLVYYALVLIGLQYWNRVISWELVTSYSQQLSGLAEVLDVSPAAVIFVACLIYAGTFALTWFYLKRFDWAVPLTQRMSRSALVTCTLLVSAILSIEVLVVFSSRPDGDGEPVAMTFHPTWVSERLQTHAIDINSSRILDRSEDAARAAYRLNPDAQKANLILIVVDALRPTNMGVFGYARDTTPYLSTLAKEGALTLVDGVRSSCSESACGITSLLTSKYVHQFSSRPFGLYEVLKKYGYEIHLILGGDHRKFYGLANAYGTVDSFFDAGLVKGRYFNDDQIVLDRAAQLPKWNGTPTALHFHLMSAHVLGAKEGATRRFLPAANYALPQNQTADQKQSVVNYYDNGVLKTDAVIQNLLTTLEAKGFLQSSLVVITADHGEALGEHGSYTHAQGVWDEVLRIPLLVQTRGTVGEFKVARSGVAQIDIAPSILYSMNMPRPSTWAGTPIQLPSGTSLQYFLQHPNAGLVDLRDPKNIIKVWIDRKTGQGFIFNLSEDPRESRNLDTSVPHEKRNEWRARIVSLPPVEEFHVTLFTDSPH